MEREKNRRNAQTVRSYSLFFFCCIPHTVLLSALVDSEHYGLLSRWSSSAEGASDSWKTIFPLSHLFGWPLVNNSREAPASPHSLVWKSAAWT